MLQKNVLDYLDASAARFPDKVAFADDQSQFTFAQLAAAAGGLGPFWPGTAPGTISRWSSSSTTPPPTWPRSWVCVSAGLFYVPLMRCRCPGWAFWRPLPAAVYPPGCQEKAQFFADLCPLLSAEEGFLCPHDPALLAQRRAQVLDIDPVYAIFTSGSTGKPKGIVISHRSVIDFTEWDGRCLPVHPPDILGNQAPFLF